ncbi:hypothetical protein AB0M95_40965 [Sphaerisporangium sp. NPDC051017]|uniref:hypothetical protein n=1 Tax=Sphaerisporangium sp. NPDC051017 TaxID=3154636 RepID=UPI0034299A47
MATLSRNGEIEGDDPMRRRTLLTAAGLSIPLSLLQRFDDALALSDEPDQPERLSDIRQRLQVARRQFDVSALPSLVAGLPGLLAVAKACAERIDTPTGWTVLAACYNLSTDVLNKVGRKPSAVITADRGVIYAQRSGDAVAMAASARAMGMMLRTSGRNEVAAQTLIRAAGRLDALGLRTARQTDVYVRLLCAAAYATAGSGA